MTLVNVAAALHNIFWSDLEGSRIIGLLEVTRELTLMVVLPPDQPRDLLHKLGVRDIASCLVHGTFKILLLASQKGTLVAASERWNPRVVPQAASLVARLISTLASGNIEDQGITRDLLVCLELDDVTGLKTAPVAKLETFVSLQEHELFDWL